MTATQSSPQRIAESEEKARRRDPDGTAPATEAAKEEPAGVPDAGRHTSETAAHNSQPKK